MAAAPVELLVAGVVEAAASEAVGVGVADSVAELLVDEVSGAEKSSALRVPQFSLRFLVQTSWPALLFSFALMQVS